MGANWRSEGFHLTVNLHGLVSLWDSEVIARSTPADESYLFLRLLPEQVEAIERAQKLAARKVQRKIQK